LGPALAGRSGGSLLGQIDGVRAVVVAVTVVVV
jgi:hypothetical protein